MKHLTNNKKKLLLSLAALSALFILLRIRYIGHLLMWDEAWNILSLRAYVADAAKDPFYWFYNFHPPLYMFLASLLEPFKSGFDMRAEFLSLAVSYGCFVVMFALAAGTGGWRYASLSGIFLSVMPLSMAYDTWVKRDNLACLLGYSAILMLFRKKYFWCGVLLALSCLSKENAAFFMAAAVALLFILKAERPLAKTSLIFFLVFAMSGWWYLGAGGSLQRFVDFYFSENIYQGTWSRGPFYYILKLLPDLGPVQLALLVPGLVFLVYTALLRGKRRWITPAVILACVYLPVSVFLSTKTPWISLSAAPAAAMVSAGGMMLLLKYAKRYAVIQPLAAILVILAVIQGVNFSYSGYHERTYPNGWPGALSSRKLAYYLNSRMEEDDRLLITHFAYWDMPACPVFLYYWDRHPVKVINGNTPPEKVMEAIKNGGFSWVVVADSPDPARNYHALVREMGERLPSSPAIVGWSYVWETRELPQKADIQK
jgi:4-amino-4-deoxy-L-arabinose transferase-like glycosyltransferase